jgi:hypothetical protein
MQAVQIVRNFKERKAREEGGPTAMNIPAWY